MNNNNSTEEKIQEKRPVFYKKEMKIMGIAVLAIALVITLLSLIYNSEPTYKEILNKITINTAYLPFLAMFSVFDALAITLIGILLKPVGDEKPVVKSVRNWVLYSILLILGIAAYFVIVFGLDLISCPFWCSNLLASLIFSAYLYLMLKLYFYDYIQEKGIFYEIVRFALVGVIASIFDLSTCYLFQFVILPSSLDAIWLTLISVTMGFLVGVVVNYLCSVYMVFKNTTSKDSSRTTKGKILFFVFALVGLGFGYLLQYLFYDVLAVGYVTTFVIRTLIVLVWNYLSRKYFIFK